MSIAMNFRRAAFACLLVLPLVGGCDSGNGTTGGPADAGVGGGMGGNTGTGTSGTQTGTGSGPGTDAATGTGAAGTGTSTDAGHSDAAHAPGAPKHDH